MTYDPSDRYVQEDLTCSEPDDKHPPDPPSGQVPLGISDPCAFADPESYQRTAELADRLEGLLSQAPQYIESITQTLDGFDTLAASVAEAAEGSLRKVEDACKRAETLEQKLSEAADRMVGEGENAQGKIKELLGGLDAGNSLQSQLQACVEQVKQETDQSQNAASRQTEKLRKLLDDCDEKLNEQIKRATRVSEELEQTHRSAQTRLHSTGEAIRKKVGKFVGSRLREFDHAIEQAASKTLERANGIIEKCAETSSTLNRDAGETERRARQLGHVCDEVSAVLGKAEEVSGSLKQQIGDASLAQEIVKKLNREAAATVQRGEEALARRQSALASLLDEVGGITKSLAKSKEAADRQTDQLSNQLHTAGELEQKLTRAVDTTRQTLNAGKTAATEMSTMLARADETRGVLKQQATEADNVRQSLSKVHTQAETVFENLTNIREATRERTDQLTDQFHQTANLEKRLSQAGEAADGNKAELSGVMAKAEALVADLEARCTQASKTAETAEATSRKLCEDSNSLIKFGEASMSRHQRILADIIEEAKTLAKNLKTQGDNAGQTAQQLTDLVTSATNQCKMLHELNAGSEELAADIERRYRDTNTTAEENLARIKQQLTDLAQNTTTVEEAFARVKQELSELEEGTTSTARENLTQIKQKLTDLAENTTTTAEEVCTRVKQELSELEEGTTSTAQENLTRIKQELTDLAQNTTTTAEEVFARVKRELSELEEGTTSTAQENLAWIKRELTDLTHDTTTTTQEVFTQVKQELTRLEEHTTIAAEQTLVWAKQELSQLEKGTTGIAEENLTRIKQELTTFIQNVDTTTKETRDKIKAELAALTRDTDELVSRQQQSLARLIAEANISAEQRVTLEAVTQEARALADLLRSSIEIAEQNCEQLSTRTHTAVEAEGALCQITAAAHEIRDRIEYTREPLSKQITQARDLLTALGEACSAGDGVQQKVHGLNQDVLSLIEGGEEVLARQYNVLMAAIDDAKQRMDDLRQGAAGAAVQRDEITAQCRKAAATATEAADRVDTLIKEVWSLTTGTEQRVRELASETHYAAELLKDFEPARTEMENLHKDLAAASETGREMIEQLKVQIGGGNETSDHLKIIQEDCMRVVERLAGHCEKAKGIAGHVSKIAAQLHQDHDAIAANKQTLQELGKQGVLLREMVQQAQITAEGLQVQVNNLLSEPQSIVCEAKQQSLQLTNVCRAVKKVFSGLSKTSLLANEKIDQLSRLHSDVTQATETLRQWVGEAVHVQKRLESTVQQTPGIGQTHPPKQLYSLTEPICRSQTTTRQKPQTRASEPKGDRSGVETKPAERLNPDHRINPEEVANLIADAKRQCEREKHLVPMQ